MCKLLSFCALFVSILSVSAESVFDALSITQTEYEFTLNDGPLEVGAQGITQRAVKETITKTDADGNVTQHDVAYQAYHLEFVYRLKFIDRRQYGVVEFYDYDELVHVIDLEEEGRRIVTSGGRRYEANFMAISLEGIPLVLLDHVDRINFRKAK